MASKRASKLRSRAARVTRPVMTAPGAKAGRAAGDFQDLAGRQGGAAADAAEPGLVVEVALVAQARVEVAAFALQVFVLEVGVAELAVAFGVVVGLAVGGGGAAGLVDLAVEVGVSIAVVIGADVDLPFHHLMAGLQVPDAVFVAAAQAGGRVVRQAHIELVAALVVAELHHVDAQALVAGEAVPDADVGQQTADEHQSLSLYCITCSRRGTRAPGERRNPDPGTRGGCAGCSTISGTDCCW
jgi:hypothetical protein